MESGAIHSSGIAAMSVDRYVVTLSIRLDGTAARTTHRARRARVTGRTAPSDPVSAGGAAVASALRAVSCRACVRHRPAAQAAASGTEGPVDPGPEAALLVEPEQALDDRRVGQEGEETSDVAGRVEDVGIAGGPVLRGGEPGLEDRAGGGHREEGEPDRDGEEREEPRHGTRVTGRDPARRQRDREGHDRQEQHREVKDRLPPRAQPARGDVRVGIPHEQDRLVEHHGRVPHGGRAAEERQRHPREHGLDEEQEPGADEDRRAEQDQHARSRRGLSGALTHEPGCARVHTERHRAPRATVGRESTRWAS